MNDTATVTRRKVRHAMGSRARRLHVAIGGSRSANVKMVEETDCVSKREGVSK